MTRTGRTPTSPEAQARREVPPPPQRLQWRVLRDPPGRAAWNMAVDEALARSRTGSEAVLRLYRWARPTLSFGRNQDPRPRYDPLALAARGAEAVRRPTGGREVLHDRELTYTVVAPFAGPGSLRGLYHTVNQALLAALEALGVPGAALAGRSGPTPRPDAGACFGTPAPGEVVARGGKLVGSAQRRLGPTILQHGSLLLAPASLSLAALAVPGRPPSEQEGTHLAALLGRRPGVAEVAATVEAAMAGTFGGDWARGDGLTPAEAERARALTAIYADPDHVWGEQPGMP
jgi:lipoate-protein ligase A